MRKCVLLGVVAALVAAGVWWFVSGSADGRGGLVAGEGAPAEAVCSTPLPEAKAAAPSGGARAAAPAEADGEGGSPDHGDEAEEPMSEEEKAAAAEEAKVDAFDELTDRWMEPAKGGVTMKDVDAFAKAFRQVPKDRQDECIHRALNLVPDENVMLLAGVLMDKTADKEIVEAVFNDVLNRDEDVKKPILQQIFKDKTHPCWADTAWILDVTDDLPKAK